MKLFTLILIFLTKILLADEFQMSVTGTDKYLHIMEIKENESFIVYENNFQFTTNSILYGYGKCAGTIEILNGQQDQNIICQFNDNNKNLGSIRSVPAAKKNIKELQIGKIIGTSIAYWEWISGTGPFEELVGLTIPCAYFAMQDSNWMSMCKFEVSETTMNRMNNYKSNNKE